MDAHDGSCQNHAKDDDDDDEGERWNQIDKIDCNKKMIVCLWLIRKSCSRVSLVMSGFFNGYHEYNDGRWILWWWERGEGQGINRSRLTKISGVKKSEKTKEESSMIIIKNSPPFPSSFIIF